MRTGLQHTLRNQLHQGSHTGKSWPWVSVIHPLLSGQGLFLAPSQSVELLAAVERG